MRLLLRSAFNRYSGYGNDAVDIAIGLDRAGIDVHVHPTSIIAGLPKEFTDLLQKKPPRGVGSVDATMQFGPPFSIAVSTAGKSSYRSPGLPRPMAPFHYGWSMWETTKLEKSDMRGHKLGQAPWKALDVMYVTTRMNIESFQNFDKRPAYRLMPCGIDPDLFPVRWRSPKGTTRFCMVGELHERKDPFVAIEAFRRLKQKHGDAFDAELWLKTTISGLHPAIEQWVDGIKLINERWEFQDLIAWYGQMDCMLAPSRGEGNHKPPMEFMATGGTVIATNWSGATNWMHSDAGYPLDYELMPVKSSRPDGPKNARASVDHLEELMWRVHTNRAEAVRKGKLAAEWIRQTMGWRKIIDRLVGEMEQDQRLL